MKKTLIITLFLSFFILNGCGLKVENLNSKNKNNGVNQNSTPSNTEVKKTNNQALNKPETLTYLISKEPKNNYCNGNQMNSEEYKKTINFEVETEIRIENMTLTELAKATILASIDGQCKNVMENNEIRVQNDTVFIAPIDGWAGISIVMCSCKPQIEVNLLRLAGINKVIFESSIKN